MDLDEYFKKNPMGQSCAPGAATDEGFKSGFVTLVGRPNAGKSTLLNKVVGAKVAITSKTSQTTRRRIRAVKTTDTYQLVLVDTPGLHKPKDVLGEELNATAIRALEDADAIAMLIDTTAAVSTGDKWVAAHVRACDTPKICVLTKCDLASPEQTQAQAEAAGRLAEWDAVISLSAKSGHNVDAFVGECVFFLPEGPLWFPADMDTDETDEALAAEIVREKVLRGFRDEVPHSVGVMVDHMSYSTKKQLYTIEASIYVERDSQKAILIGKGGRAIKKIGSEARTDLEGIFGCKVFLDLTVKVKKGWRADGAQLKRFGYME